MKTKLLLLISIIMIMFQFESYGATFTVTSNANGTTVDGVSLRWAITQANATVGADIIDFNLGAAASYTITLTSALPNLTDNAGVTINGWENGLNDGVPNTIPVASATASTPMNATYRVVITTNNTFNSIFQVFSNNNVIKGLVLTNWGVTPCNLTDICINISGTGNQILGCYIGTDITGTTIGGLYQATGIYVFGSNNVIGDGTAAGANILSGSKWTGGAGGGIRLEYTSIGGSAGAGHSGTTVRGNMIGLQKDGVNQISGSNNIAGIGIGSNGTVSNCTIGGNVAGQGNVISGNSIGLNFYGNATGINVYGNIIGPCADGNSVVPSNRQGTGILLDGTSNNIGSTSSYNIISCNTNRGIYASDASCSGNLIKGNYIGPNASLTAISGASQGYGIMFSGSATDNIIGGILAGERNIITKNTGTGIYITGASCDGNKITGNLIYSNNGNKPIELTGTGNTNKTSPTISSSSTITLISGTSTAGDVIQVFRNTTNDDYDAEVYVGTATANGAGNWSLVVALSGNVFNYITATATNGSNNTSELSSRITALPIELIDFSATCDYDKVSINWSTSSETNNDYFTIERTSDGVDDLTEFIVDGSGNSSSVKEYTFIDNKPLPGVSYYRLKQTDFDGKYQYFKYVAVSCKDAFSSEINVYPNPSNGSDINIAIQSSQNTEILVVLYDVNGKTIYSKINILDVDGNNIIAVDLQEKLAPGIYFVTATSNNKMYNKKLIVE